MHKRERIEKVIKFLIKIAPAIALSGFQCLGWYGEPECDFDPEQK